MSQPSQEFILKYMASGQVSSRYGETDESVGKDIREIFEGEDNFFCSPSPVSHQDTLSFYEKMKTRMSIRDAESVWTTVCQLGIGMISMSEIGPDRRRFIMSVYRVWQMMVEADMLGVPLLVETIEITRNYDRSFYFAMKDVMEAVKKFRRVSSNIITADNASAAVLSHCQSTDMIVGISALLVETSDAQKSVTFEGIVNLEDNKVESHFHKFCYDMGPSDEIGPLMMPFLLDIIDEIPLDFRFRCVNKFYLKKFNRKYQNYKEYPHIKNVGKSECLGKFPDLSPFGKKLFEFFDYNSEKGSLWYVFKRIPDLVALSIVENFVQSYGAQTGDYDRTHKNKGDETCEDIIRLEFSKLSLRPELSFLREKNRKIVEVKDRFSSLQTVTFRVDSNIKKTYDVMFRNKKRQRVGVRKIPVYSCQDLDSYMKGLASTYYGIACPNLMDPRYRVSQYLERLSLGEREKELRRRYGPDVYVGPVHRLVISDDYDFDDVD